MSLINFKNRMEEQWMKSKKFNHGNALSVPHYLLGK